MTKPGMFTSRQKRRVLGAPRLGKCTVVMISCTEDSHAAIPVVSHTTFQHGSSTNFIGASADGPTILSEKPPGNFALQKMKQNSQGTYEI